MSGDPFDLELATAALLSDSHDVQFLLQLLARQLTGALGDRVTVERDGGLFRRRTTAVRSLRVTVGDDEYLATEQVCSVGHDSGGIRIRTEKVSMDEWLSRLLRALQEEATHNQAARMALENLLLRGGPP
ncbi:MAG TPA: hypothetical protein VFN68_15465 [Acidimicrobiales bacterium]|nr:hypothetical protein [Acidimicrobiales bacterium]